MVRRIFAALFVVAALIGFYLNPLQIGLEVGSRPVANEVTTQARDLSLVCPGALYQVGGKSGTSLEVVRAGSAKLAGNFEGGTSLKLVERRLVGEAETVTGSLSNTLVDAKSLTVQDPTGSAAQGSQLLNALQVQSAKLNNLAGLAAANCIRPSSDSWLIGGDTGSGRETLLVMSNPTDVDATVNIEILGPGGKIESPGMSSISVPKNKTTVLPISGVAPNLATFAVHVVSKGGSLGTWLQQRTVRGLVPGGVDFIAPTTQADTRLAIPGVYLRGVADAGKLMKANDSYIDLVPTLRVTSTSNENTTVTAQILGSNEATFGTVIQEVVPPNATIDIPINGLRDGDYVAFVDATSPVRAALRLSRTKATQTDFTWLPAVTASSNQLGFTAPAVAITKIAIANPGEKPAQVRVGSRRFTLAAAATETLLIPAGSSGSISSDVPVSATLIIDIDGTVASVPVIDYQNLGGLISILVR